MENVGALPDVDGHDSCSLNLKFGSRLICKVAIEEREEGEAIRYCDVGSRCKRVNASLLGFL